MMTVGPLLMVVVGLGVAYYLVDDALGAGADLKELPPALPPLLAADASPGKPIIRAAEIIIVSMEPLNHWLVCFSGSGS